MSYSFDPRKTALYAETADEIASWGDRLDMDLVQENLQSCWETLHEDEAHLTPAAHGSVRGSTAACLARIAALTDYTDEAVDNEKYLDGRVAAVQAWDAANNYTGADE